MARNQRKRNLILPLLQLKITMVFVSTSAVMLALMGFLTLRALEGHSMGGSAVLPVVQPALTQAFWATFLVMLPVTLVVGVLATFLMAGPLYKFEGYLRAITRGDHTAPCKLRDGDELQSFCDTLNTATAPLRTTERATDEAA